MLLGGRRWMCDMEYMVGTYICVYVNALTRIDLYYRCLRPRDNTALRAAHLSCGPSAALRCAPQVDRATRIAWPAPWRRRRRAARVRAATQTLNACGASQRRPTLLATPWLCDGPTRLATSTTFRARMGHLRLGLHPVSNIRRRLQTVSPAACCPPRHLAVIAVAPQPSQVMSTPEGRPQLIPFSFMPHAVHRICHSTAMPRESTACTTIVPVGCVTAGPPLV